MSRLPLEGIRVLDSTYVFALPYTGGQLTDLGAEVIKVEGPGRPDITRTGGLYGTFPDNIVGEDWWNRPSTYNLLNRGKRSLTLDLSTEPGRELFRQMVSLSDVVMENFTPRVMRGWGLDYPKLKKIKPDIILVSNTGYGHGDGPYSSYPAQATTQEGTHGHCWVTGYPGEGPAKAGRSFVDFLSTWSAVFAIGAALRYRNLTGKGQWVDIGMYQAGVMFISEYIMDAIANGREGGRIGNRHPYRAPQGCYPAQGHDQWITLSVASDEEWQSLCALMGRAELAHDPRYAGVLSRQQTHDQIDEIISSWTRDRDRYDLMHLLQGAGIAAGPVLNSKDVHLDPHYQSRNFLERVDFPPERQMGARILMGRPFKFSNTPMKIRQPAPEFGEGNEHFLKGLLGVDEKTYQALVQDAIIASIPTSGDPAPAFDPPEALARGQIADWDPDYRQRLGLS
ncbi:MAG TPA: CoA transferase [Dehalococcoidia bacterium]|nr:CoA transferase [Dehalococcoidia bacterium]